MSRALAYVFVAGAGLVSVGNGLWMLAGAWGWFARIPGVTDTGAPNAHFIHDVGVVYLLLGSALLWVLRAPRERYAVFCLCALFYALHALGHVAEILLGQLPHTHWWIDLPLVFLPGVGLAVLMLPPLWRATLARTV